MNHGEDNENEIANPGGKTWKWETAETFLRESGVTL